MPQSATCVKCGSTYIILKARVLDRSEYGESDLRVRVDADPMAFVFMGTEKCPLEARVCGHCGYTELYATDPATLLTAWRRSQESPKG